MRKHRLLALLLAPLLLLAACGGGGDSLESKDSGGGDKGTVVVGGQDFTESQVLAEIYKALLDNAGYKVTTKLVTTRDVYMPALSKGTVDIVPDYLSGIVDFLNTDANGADAPLVSSHDPAATLAAGKPLADAKGISLLTPSEATDQNAFVVTKDFADQNSLTTLSDFAAMGQSIKLGAPPDCEGRADCAGGLEGTYGFKISEIVPLDFGSSQLKDAVKNGEVQLGETGTTDGTLDQLGLVLLEDDKGIQPAQNLTPAVNTAFLKKNPDLSDLFDKLSSALTTDDLAKMNTEVDLDRKKPADVAEAFLKDKGLL
jgi:osmoprotectant transport system substrate-binding protein